MSGESLLILFVALLLGFLGVLLVYHLRYWKDIPSQCLLLCLILLAGSFIVREFFIPHMPHVYMDEFYWFVRAKSLYQHHPSVWEVHLGSIAHPLVKLLMPRPVGYSILENIAFFFGGVSFGPVYQMNVLLGALTPAFVFGISWLLFRHTGVAFLSGLILASLPVHLKFSGCANRDVAAVFFLSAGTFFFLLYNHCRRKVSFYAAIVALAFMAHVKPEYLLWVFYSIILAVVGSRSGGFSREDRKEFTLLLLAMIVPLLLTAPQMIAYENGVAQGFLVSWADLLQNLKESMGFLTSLRGVLFMAGAVLLMIYARRQGLALFGAFLSGFILVQAYFVGANERYTLLFSLPFALIAGYAARIWDGLGKMRRIAFTVLVCVGLLWASWRDVRDDVGRWSRREAYQEYVFIKENLGRVPKGAYIVCVDTNIISALDDSDRKVARLGSGVLDNIVPRLDVLVLYAGRAWHDNESWSLPDRNALRKTYKFITMVEKDVGGKKIGFYFLVKKR